MGIFNHGQITFRTGLKISSPLLIFRTTIGSTVTMQCRARIAMYYYLVLL